MKNLGFLLLLTCFSAIAVGQTFLIGSTSTVFTDSSRSNRQIPVEIYYPANINGSNVPVAGVLNQTFPVISFGHGFVMGWDSYRNYWEALVPQGYIMVFPKTETGFSPSHLEFAKDLAFVISKMQNENTNTQSAFYGKIYGSSVLMGHSMGGGSAVLASQFLTSPHTIVPLAPAETNPSAIAAAQNIQIPSLVLAGSNDCVTPPSQHQIPIYQALSGTCKTYVEISGASHCQFANSNFNCNFGELTCSPSASITRAQQHAIIFRLLIPWLEAQLYANCVRWNDFQTDLQSSSDISSQQSCTFCTVSAVSSESKAPFDFYPNPANNKIILRGLQPGSLVELFNMQGIIVKSLKFEEEKSESQLILDGLPKGVYILKYSDSSSQISKKVLVF